MCGKKGFNFWKLETGPKSNLRAAKRDLGSKKNIKAQILKNRDKFRVKIRWILLEKATSASGCLTFNIDRQYSVIIEQYFNCGHMVVVVLSITWKQVFLWGRSWWYNKSAVIN